MKINIHVHLKNVEMTLLFQMNVIIAEYASLVLKNMLFLAEYLL